MLRARRINYSHMVYVLWQYVLGHVDKKHKQVYKYMFIPICINRHYGTTIDRCNSSFLLVNEITGCNKWCSQGWWHQGLRQGQYLRQWPTWLNVNAAQWSDSTRVRYLRTWHKSTVVQHHSSSFRLERYRATWSGMVTSYTRWHEHPLLHY